MAQTGSFWPASPYFVSSAASNPHPAHTASILPGCTPGCPRGGSSGINSIPEVMPHILSAGPWILCPYIPVLTGTEFFGGEGQLPAGTAAPWNRAGCFTTSAGRREPKWKIMKYGKVYFHLSSALKFPSEERGFRELNNVK